MASDSSKPYQTEIIREKGFRIPDTLITNDPTLVRKFCAQHRRVIYYENNAGQPISEGVARFLMAR